MKTAIILSLLLAASAPVASQSLTSADSTAQSQSALTLRHCIDLALQNNVQIKQRQSQNRQQQTQLHTARMQRLPDLSASASQQFSFGRSLTIDNTYANYNTANTSFSLSTSMPIFTGFRISNNVEQARLNLSASLEDLNALRDNLAVSVAQAYLQVLFAREMLGVARHQTNLSRQQLERKQAYFEADKASVSEVAEARSVVAQNELNEVQTENDLQLALLELSQLLELPSADGLDVVPIADEELSRPILRPEQTYAQALQLKPQVRAANLRIQSAEKEVKMAQSQNYPQLYFSAGMGTGYYNTSSYSAAPFADQLRDNLNKYLGFSLSIPIFNSFATQNQVKQAREQKLANELALDETRKSLYKEIQQAYYSAVAAQKKYESSLAALEAARIAFDAVAWRYEQGKSSAMEYAEQNLSVLKANSNLLQAKYDCIFRQKILTFYSGQPID